MAKNEEKTSKQVTSVEKTAGRGFIVISLAKAWFMVGGVCITFGLPMVFSWYAEDGRQLFGQYYDINNTLSIFSMVLIGGLLPAVSRFASAHKDATVHLLRIGSRTAFTLGAILLLSFYVASDTYAEYRGHPDQNIAYICAGIICVAYAFYAVHVGLINGRQAFTTQAQLDIGFTTMKVLFIIGIACAGLGVTGAFVGFAAAAVAISLWSRTQLPPIEDAKPMPPGFVPFACWMMLYTFAFNLSFKIDALMLRPALDALLASSGDVDRYMGEYGLAVSLSRLPWQSTIALTFVVFPMISEATFSEDRARTHTYIQNTIRYALILICAVALPMCARPDFTFDCLALIIPGYTLGQAALVWLAPAYIFFSLSNLHNTIFMSSGRAKTALSLMVINLVTVYVAFSTGLHEVESASTLLKTASQQLCLAFGVIGILGAIWLTRTFGCYLSVLSVLRIAAALLIAIGLSKFFTPESLILKVATLVSLPIYFLLILWASGELNTEDKRRFLSVFRRRKGDSSEQEH